jgi:hypothetical protein
MFSNKGRMIVRYSRLAIFGVIVFSIFAFAGPAFAETTAKSTNFEKTTLIEFTNNDNVEINTVRIWLGADAGIFKSFKTEKGWTGAKTPQGVLVFTSADPLSQGESVKFGIKTEIENPGINWKSLDSSGNELTVGKTIAGQEPVPQDTTPPEASTPTTPSTTSLDSATFRIIPDKPKNGDSIRIVGYGFPPNKNLNFLIDSEKIEDFRTDDDGHLIGRAKIPVTKAADRVEFSLSDDQGNKKTISLRIEHRETQMVSEKAKRLTVTQAEELVEPGDVVSVSGTGQPGATVTITAQDAAGNKIYEAVVQVDTSGVWSHETIIPLDAPLGTRLVKFSDGTDTIEKTISIAISKTIHVMASAIKYDPGTKMLFNGTAIPNQLVEVVIKDPIGKEVLSDILNLDDSGTLNFEYQTTAASPKGTYVILFTQGEETEILRIGLGEFPSEQIVAKFDKLNHATSEKARLVLQGPAKAVVSLIIIDPSDKVKVTDSVTLGPDGRNEYEIDLASYKSGVYSVVIKYLKFQTSEIFSVGLLPSSGPIIIQSTKQTYLLGDPILVLGSANKNALLTLEMTDPDGVVIKRKDIIADEDGKFSDGTFRVPGDAKQGMWTIRASSGPNKAEANLEIVGTVSQGFVIKLDKSTPYHGSEVMKITGSGGGKTQNAIITILDTANIKVVDLTTSTTQAGSFQTFWPVPPELKPGTYTVKATIGNETAEATFTIQ